MLVHLQICNLAVVDAADIEFGDGLTVLTGETGAGKSILIDALTLAMGGRAESQAIRRGAESLEVTATFDLTARDDLRDWLAEHDLAAGEDCVLRRIVSAEGRSRGYLNGRPVPMQTLRQVGERLADICGQQAHQGLRHRAAQREMLDAFGGHETLARELADAYRDWQAARERLATLTGNVQALEARRDLLSYQSAELAALAPREGEFAELESELRVVANSARIAAAVSSAIDRIYEGESGTAHDLVSVSRRDLDELSALDPALADAARLLAEAEILLTETTDALRQRLGGLDHDPDRQAELEQRMTALHELARKHRVDPESLPALADRLHQELEALDTSDERIEALKADVEASGKQVATLAEKLSEARRATARKLAAQVTTGMAALGMRGGEFRIALEPVETGPHGAEQIEFEVSANPGQPPGPLSRVASGGELSRISLALQVAALARGSVPTLIFDEVDAGVGGGIAEIVGTQLHALAAHRQVLCVTHLPQVASQGDRHLRVTKTTDGKVTQTSVDALTTAERVEEIARMLGGVEITERTREHAEEMLATATPSDCGP